MERQIMKFGRQEQFIFSHELANSLILHIVQQRLQNCKAVTILADPGVPEALVTKILHGIQQRNPNSKVPMDVTIKRIISTLTKANVSKLKGHVIVMGGKETLKTFSKLADDSKLPYTLLPSTLSAILWAICAASNQRGVYVCPKFIHTLTERQIRSGFGSIIQVYISSEVLFQSLESLLQDLFEKYNGNILHLEFHGALSDFLLDVLKRKASEEVTNFLKIGSHFTSILKKHYGSHLRTGEAISIGIAISKSNVVSHLEEIASSHSFCHTLTRIGVVLDSLRLPNSLAMAEFIAKGEPQQILQVSELIPEALKRGKKEARLELWVLKRIGECEVATDSLRLKLIEVVCRQHNKLITLRKTLLEGDKNLMPQFIVEMKAKWDRARINNGPNFRDLENDMRDIGLLPEFPRHMNTEMHWVLSVLFENGWLTSCLGQKVSVIGEWILMYANVLRKKEEISWLNFVNQNIPFDESYLKHFCNLQSLWHLLTASNRFAKKSKDYLDIEFAIRRRIFFSWTLNLLRRSGVNMGILKNVQIQMYMDLRDSASKNIDDCQYLHQDEKKGYPLLVDYLMEHFDEKFLRTKFMQGRNDLPYPPKEPNNLLKFIIGNWIHIPPNFVARVVYYFLLDVIQQCVDANRSNFKEELLEITDGILSTEERRAIEVFWQIDHGQCDEAIIGMAPQLTYDDKEAGLPWSAALVHLGASGQGQAVLRLLMECNYCSDKISRYAFNLARIEDERGTLNMRRTIFRFQSEEDVFLNLLHEADLHRLFVPLVLDAFPTIYEESVRNLIEDYVKRDTFGRNHVLPLVAKFLIPIEAKKKRAGVPKSIFENWNLYPHYIRSIMKEEIKTAPGRKMLSRHMRFRGKIVEEWPSDDEEEEEDKVDPIFKLLKWPPTDLEDRSSATTPSPPSTHLENGHVLIDEPCPPPRPVRRLPVQRLQVESTSSIVDSTFSSISSSGSSGRKRLRLSHSSVSHISESESDVTLTSCPQIPDIIPDGDGEDVANVVKKKNAN